MIICPDCKETIVRKNGIIEREIMKKSGKYLQKVQAYRCENGYRFTQSKREMWDDSFIETVVFVYLRCLSLNTTIDIVRMFYEIDVLTKGLILSFIKSVADALPTLDDIDRLFHPIRSGYLAFDGVWFSYGREEIVPVKSVKTSKRMSSPQKHNIKVFQLLFHEAIYATTKDKSIEALLRLKRYVGSGTHSYEERFLKAYRSLIHNFKYTLTHFDYPHMRRDNNLLECFNGILKPRLDLMRGFKKEENLDRYLKLFLLEYRFHSLKESRFVQRRGNSPLQVAGVVLSPYYNFMTYLRSHLTPSYKLNSV